MINHMLDALQDKSATVTSDDNENFVIKFETNMNSKMIATMIATIQKGSNYVYFDNLSNGAYFRNYIKESELMAIIYYINEYGE